MAKKFRELTMEEVYGKNKQEMLAIIGVDEFDWDTMSEKEQCEFLDIPLNEWFKLEDHLYHNPITPGLSSSGMKTIVHKSPAAYKEFKDNPEVGSRDALIMGSAIHTKILEPEKFDDEYYVIEDGIRKNSAAWKKYENDANGREIIKQSAYNDILGMEASLSKMGYLPIMRESMTEHAIFAYDEEFDVVLRVKADAVTDKIVIDLKSTIDASPDGFLRNAVIKYGYDLQHWLYLKVCELTKQSRAAFTFVAVEKKRPYVCMGYTIDQGQIELYSNIVAREAIETYAYCLKTNNWFGYEISNIKKPTKQLFKTLEMPNWFLYPIEEKADFKI